LCHFIVSNFPSVPTVFHQFFTCIALRVVHLCFSLVSLRTASSVEEEINELHDYITDVISPYT